MQNRRWMRNINQRLFLYEHGENEKLAACMQNYGYLYGHIVYYNSKNSHTSIPAISVRESGFRIGLQQPV